jgi:hypothetical protein
MLNSKRLEGYTQLMHFSEKNAHHRSSSRAHHGFSQESTQIKLDSTRYAPRDSRRLLSINHKELGGLTNIVPEYPARKGKDLV